MFVYTVESFSFPTMAWISLQQLINFWYWFRVLFPWEVYNIYVLLWHTLKLQNPANLVAFNPLIHFFSVGDNMVHTGDLSTILANFVFLVPFNAEGEKTSSPCRDYCIICCSRIWVLLVLQEWGPYKTSRDASSERNTTFLACNIHHLGEWYGAWTYLHCLYAYWHACKAILWHHLKSYRLNKFSICSWSLSILSTGL